MSRKLIFNILTIIVGCGGLLRGQTNPGLVLSNIGVYADSTFESDVRFTLRRGAIVQILDKSKIMHDDMTQNQMFYWFLVRDSIRGTGWVFGDDLAVLQSTPEANQAPAPAQTGPFNLGKRFERTVFLIGRTEGKDHPSSHFSAHNFYRENYFVFMNPNQRAVFLPVGTESERGINRCRSVYLADLTGDNYLDVIIYRSLRGKEMSQEMRKLEVYQLDGTEFRLIFERVLNVYQTPGIASPARFMAVDISPEGMRFEYPEYGACATDLDTGSYKVHCMRWLSETLVWNEVTGAFENFYPPARRPLKARFDRPTVFVRQRPDIISPVLYVGRSGQPVTVLAEVRQYKRVKGKRTVRWFFRIKTATDVTGYVPVDRIAFVRSAHAPLLNKFYRYPLDDTRAWRKEIDFVRVRGFGQAPHWELSGLFGQGFLSW